MHRHPVQPGGEGALPLEPADAPVHLDEDVLQHVLEVGAGHQEGELARHLPVMLGVELAKRGDVAGLRPLDDVGPGHRVTHQSGL